MLERHGGYLRLRQSPAPEASLELEVRGYAVLRGVFSRDEVARMHRAFAAVFDALPPDGRSPARSDEEDGDFRYEMFNRDPQALAAISHPQILAVIEPLLGEDCHVIANTCWRNPPRAHSAHGGGFWHIDAGPHVPRDPAVPWDERIPYPVFAIGAHIYLEPSDLASGPTGVLPFSHKSGRHPPRDRMNDDTLTYDGHAVVPLTAEPGDVALFVSDVWHRRLPVREGDRGRFFLQAHYGRRDIAQRVKTTAQVNHVDDTSWVRGASERQRQLLGLHAPFFYDG